VAGDGGGAIIRFSHSRGITAGELDQHPPAYGVVRAATRNRLHGEVDRLGVDNGFSADSWPTGVGIDLGDGTVVHARPDDFSGLRGGRVVRTSLEELPAAGR